MAVDTNNSNTGSKAPIIKAKRRIRLKKSERAGDKKGIIYLGHIPEEFGESEMREYFKQFGTVKNVKVSRSSKTGRSKGYGFIQFEDEDVAKIAAESMDKYIMFKRALKANLKDPAQVHERTFEVTSVDALLRKEKNLKNSIRVYNASTGTGKKSRRAAAKLAKRKKNLANLGFRVEKSETGKPQSEVEAAGSPAKKAKLSEESEKVHKPEAKKKPAVQKKKDKQSIRFASPPDVSTNTPQTQKTPQGGGASAQKTDRKPGQSSGKKYPKTPVPNKHEDSEALKQAENTSPKAVSASPAAPKTPGDGSPALPAPKQKKQQTAGTKQDDVTDSKSPKAQLFKKTPKKTHPQISPRVTRSAAKRKAAK